VFDVVGQTVVDVVAPTGNVPPDAASRKRKSRDKKNTNKRPRGAAYRLDLSDTDKLSPVSGARSSLLNIIL